MSRVDFACPSKRERGGTRPLQVRRQQKLWVLSFLFPLEDRGVDCTCTSYSVLWTVLMDQITIKTTNPKCRLYWFLIEFMIGDTVSHVGIFDPSCELVNLWTPLTFSLVRLPPPRFSVWISTGLFFIQCVTGGGGDWVVCRAMSYTLCIWPDSEPTKLLYHPRGPQTDKHLPPGSFTGQIFRKTDI
jgi:hypothetical protein